MRPLRLQNNFFAAGVLPELNFRFVLADIGTTAREAEKLHQASPQMTALMGEVMLGCFFLSTAAVKQSRSTISLHLECEGPAGRIIGFASNDGDVRSHTSNPDASWDGSLHSGKKGGIMRIHRWKENEGRVYSSTVEMRDVALDRNLEEYMGKSDQVQSFIKFQSELDSSGVNHLCGYMFQALPEADADDTDALLDLLNARRPAQLLEDLNDQSGGSMRRGGLFFSSARILSTGHFFASCTCNKEKVEGMLVTMGSDSLKDLLQQEGRIEVKCEFCKKKYLFSPTEIDRLLNGISGQSA